MAAGDSDVSICNLALSFLGEDPIIARTDNTRRAILCNLHYDNVRRAVLRRHPWRCARTRAKLAALAVAPLFDYGYAYQKPADYIRAFDMPADDMPRWEVEGDSILSDLEPPLQLVYVKDLQDVSRMDSLLVDAIALALAVNLAMPLTQSDDKEARVTQRLADHMAEAKTISGQEASPMEWDEDIWLRTRA